MKLSIIVPAYNVELTLRRCLDSIISQSSKDYEIILVDDGSIDKSGKIADSYASIYNNVKAFHKDNGGLSDARNYGLDRASGDYVTFIDSDDEIDPETLAKLMAILNNHPEYDILEYSVIERVGCPDEHVFKPEDKVFNDALDWLSAYGFEHCWAWNKIYKRRLFDDVRFSVGKLFEDAIMIGELLPKNPIIAMTSVGTYLYHWNGEGIVAQQNLLPLLKAQMAIVKNMDIDTRQRKWHRLYFDMLANQLHVYRQSGNILLWSQHIAVKRYNGWGDCLKAALLNILGLKMTCKITNLLYRIK